MKMILVALALVAAVPAAAEDWPTASEQHACTLHNALINLRAAAQKLPDGPIGALRIQMGRTWFARIVGAPGSLGLYEFHQVSTAAILEMHYGLNFKSTMELLDPMNSAGYLNGVIRFFENRYASQCPRP
jgi:hypothetical protein